MRDGVDAEAAALGLFGGLILYGLQHATDDPVGEALAGVVGPLVRAIAAGETDRFRICANDGCGWAFEDTSRGGRRRWCEMSSCGNRAKVRRFRSRRKGGGPRIDRADTLGAGGRR